MATVTLYASKDAIMAHSQSGSFSGWNGRDNHIWVGSDFSDTYKNRGLVYFSINFSGWISILSATLTMYKHAPGNHVTPSVAATVGVYSMTKDWGEGTDVGEGSLDSTQPWDWDSRANAFTGLRVDTNIGTGNSSGNNGDPFTWDVTNQVTAWFNGAPNYGFMLFNTSENALGAGREFHAREQGSSFRPQLTIVYNANTAPTPPNLSSPTGGVVINTVTPIFNGVANDVDAGDYVSAVQVKVYPNSSTNTALGTPIWASPKITVTGKSRSFSIPYGTGSTSPTPLSGNVNYKWLAQTWDKGDLPSGVSNLASFKTNIPPSAPTVVVVNTPNSDIQTTSPTFQITHNDVDPGDSKMYGHQVIVQDLLGNVAWNTGQLDDSGSPITTKNVPSTTLAWGTAYRVKAATKDSNNAWSTFSAWQNFTTHKMLPPTSLSPTDNNGTSLVPTFSGSRGASFEVITSYRIVVYQDDLSGTMWDTGVISTGITSGASFSIVYAGSALSGGLSYQWKIQATGSIGGTSDWSPLQRFNILDATVVTPSAPITSGISTLTPAFVASRASSFNRYRYEVYPSTARASNLGTSIYASGTLSTTIASAGLGTQFTSAAYPGPALTWASSFFWRASVSSDAGVTWSGWTGLTPFSTTAAATPIQTSVDAIAQVNNIPWTTNATPVFLVTRGDTTNIDKAQIRVWDKNKAILIWDSGMVDVTNASTASVTYAGPALTPGTFYSWDAAIQNVIGPISNFSTDPDHTFRYNAPPDAPSGLFPTPSYVFPDTLFPYFSAAFSDKDLSDMGDYPTAWDVAVELADGTPVGSTKVITSSLIVGLNTYQWTGGDTALTYFTDYRFRTRYKDSLGVYGTWSGYNAFKCAVSPDGTISTPSNGSNVTTVTPTITWTYTGGTQQQFVIDVDEANPDGSFIRNEFHTTVITASNSYALPSGHIHDARYYNITLTVTSTDGLDDPTPSTVNVLGELDPPNPITGLSTTIDEGKSKVTLNWDPVPLKGGHTFVVYNIYRKLRDDADWALIGTVTPKSTTTYDDWYAGAEVDYLYRVTNATTKSGTGIELESPDDSGGGSIAPALLDTDVWMFIGQDRSLAHIQSLPVTDESHEQLVQQESFEVLGSNRKVIIRGFVLGNEGTITCDYNSNIIASPADSQVMLSQTLIGRQLVDYLTNNAGPHILKSPFGDVWVCEFAGPKFKWTVGGNLNVQLSWIETSDRASGVTNPVRSGGIG